MNEQALTHVPLKDLQPPPLNTRTVFDDEKMANLIASVEAGGIHEPLLGRRVNGHIEIVAGERRLRAATAAKLKTVPVIIRDLTDAQALEVQLIENEQREDVSALDQAAGFKRLMELDPKTYTAEALAERIGLKAASVYLRLKLLSLIEPAKKLYRAGGIDAGHAVLIARQTPADQQLILDFLATEAAISKDPTPISVRRLKQWMASHIKLDLFGPTVAEDHPKVAAKLAQLRAKGQPVAELTSSWMPPEEAKKRGVLGYGQFKEGGKPCPHQTLGAYVLGRDDDEDLTLVKVCQNTDCAVHWPEKVAMKKAAAKAAKQAKETPEAKAKRLKAEAAEKEKGVRARKLRSALVVAAAQATNKLPLRRDVLVRVIEMALDASDAFAFADALPPTLAPFVSGGGKSLAKESDAVLAQLAGLAVATRDVYRDEKGVAALFKVDTKKLAKALDAPAVQTSAPKVAKPKATKAAAKKKR